MEFGASIVSSPSSIVTLGSTGALFIRVAGTGGMICAGSCWSCGGMPCVAFLQDAFLSRRFFLLRHVRLRHCGLLLAAACVARVAAPRPHPKASPAHTRLRSFVSLQAPPCRVLIPPDSTPFRLWMHLCAVFRLRICFSGLRKQRFSETVAASVHPPELGEHLSRLHGHLFCVMARSRGANRFRRRSQQIGIL